VDDIGDYLIGTPGGYDAGMVNAWIRPPAGVVDTTFPEVFRWEGDVTLVRMLISINWRGGPFPAVTTADYPYVFHFGIIKWPGASDVAPNDFIDASDGGWDWVWKYEIPGVFQTSGGISMNLEFRHQVKSKRKLDKGEGLLLNVDATSNQPTVMNTQLDSSWTIYARWLVKLP